MYLFYPSSHRCFHSILPVHPKKKKKTRKKKFFEDWVRLTASNDAKSGMWNLPEIAYEVYFSSAFRTQELMITVNRVLWTDAVQSLAPGLGFLLLPTVAIASGWFFVVACSSALQGTQLPLWLLTHSHHCTESTKNTAASA